MPKKLVAMVPVEIETWEKSPGVWMAKSQHCGNWLMVVGLFPQIRTQQEALAALYVHHGIKPEDVKEEEK